MFWGLILKSNKKYMQTLEKPFHLAHAALDYSNSSNEPIQVMYTHEDNSYLICTLQKDKVMQCPLDLNFNEGDKLCFSTKGNGIVHLTGYLLPDDDFDDFDDEMDDIEDPDLSDLRGKLAKNKKKKIANEQEDEDDDDDAEEDDEENEMAALMEDSDDDEDNEVEDDDEEEDDDEDDEGDEEEDDESDEEEEVKPPQPKQQKLENQEKNKKQQNGISNGDATKKQKDKKQEKKPQAENGAVKKLQGGLMVQDLKSGTGNEAKPGKKIQVYYEGRLKSNNKVFDSSKSGPGFKMTLGRGEVIKGWDLGLVGMKVGGKRRITCPPALAYGAKGSPPVIPQNSTLVFDVELKNVF